MKFQDLTGKKYNLLTVVERDYSKKRTSWKCLCECGDYHIVESHTLKSGEVKSCGCLNHKLKHNMTKSRILRIWGALRSRCNNKNNDSYERYGMKGIKVCKEWDNKIDGSLNFIKWANNNGYNDSLSIDRIDNKKGYYPENCRWVNSEIQTLNRTVKAGKSGIVGVKQSKNGSWYAGITFKKQYIHLGTFWDLQEAKIARQKAEEKYFNSELRRV